MKAISSLLSASALALLSTQGARAYSEGFDLTDHTSQLNFYHQAATDLTAEQVVLDDSCVVDQVHLVALATSRLQSIAGFLLIVLYHCS